MKIMIRLFMIAVLCGAVGCTDTDVSKIFAIGKSGTVKLYSGGIIVEQWQSTGYVHTEEKSDGYLFKDSKTGKLIRVSGDVVIEQ